VKLHNIDDFVNEHGKFPDSVVSSRQYAWYKYKVEPNEILHLIILRIITNNKK